MKFLNILLQRYYSYMTYMGRVRAREVLLGSSDRVLEDAGFSRDLLESGVKAWPWQAPAVALTPLNLKHTNHRKIVRELQAVTDKELDDLGTSSSLDSEAVIIARDGINSDSERQVA